MKFYISSEDDILSGKTTDVYFLRTMEILKKENVHKKVVAEVTTQDQHNEWIVFSGLEEVANLLIGKKINLRSLKEGSIFTPFDQHGIPVPVMDVEGDYQNFAIYETPLLGLICQASGISTKSARFKKLIGNRTLLSFGVRRMHPAIAPMIDRYSYIGGCDFVSSVIGAEKLGLKPRGTMPHALILVLGEENAWKKFDEDLDPSVPRIALVDTFGDEKFASIKAAELVKNLSGIRLDTPSSRRGNFAHIIREVKWELSIRGYKNIEVIVSGGIKEENIKELMDAGADGFGIGTTISSASTIDYAMDIVEIDGKPIAKKGKFAGKKDVYRCENCGTYSVVKHGSNAPICEKCGSEMVNAMETVIENGSLKVDLPDAKNIREYVQKQLKYVSID
ncbi:MAG: nicotinate phosphoribosyltransferase [Thermoplasmata archaeon]|nr:nicotinate phosphoribosyltransferase [Thermoplasmata archaeon]